MAKITAPPVQCPRCENIAVRRSHRRRMERLLSPLALYPFRCEACQSRFHRVAFEASGVWHLHTRSSYFRLRPIRAVSYVAHAVLMLLTGQ